MSETREFSFSKIEYKNLKETVNLNKILDSQTINSFFEEWFKTEILIDKTDMNFLKNLDSRYGGSQASILKKYSEDTLKAKFITPILNQVDFFSMENNISDFYHESLDFFNLDKKIKFHGFCDYFVSKGIESPEEPYFFVQEFKRDNGSDPEFQLVAEMIAGLEKSNLSEIKGAFISGSIWNFVILRKRNSEKNYSYVYSVSENFDASKFEDLKAIFKNLLFVKREIFDLVKKEN
jgi:hypothetical protein